MSKAQALIDQSRQAKILALEAENKRLRKALLECREEFCWHGNTGNRLSVQMYGNMVDMIDAALSRKETE